MAWSDIAAQHYDWVERMNWHNKTVLESLALISSEIGEAAGECFSGFPTDAFGEELADIVLRTADLAHDNNIDLDACLAQAAVSWRGTTLLERFSDMSYDMALWINTARKGTLGPDFVAGMGNIMRRVVELSEAYGIDLKTQVQRKMAINTQRGTRGRVV